MISAIILNSDNRDIKKTLASLSWCDETLVWTKPINGDFAAARNTALKTAKMTWVLFVDSDEIVSQQLQTEILHKIKEVNEITGFYIKRTDYFWGKELKYGETAKVKLLRLAKKDSGKWERKVHEFWSVTGQVGELSNPLYHFPHPTISDFIKSINFYTDVDAKELENDGKKFNYFRVVLNPIGKFIQNYFFRLGFLDGMPGFVMAFMMSFHSLTVRVKQFDNLTVNSSKLNINK